MRLTEVPKNQLVDEGLATAVNKELFSCLAYLAIISVGEESEEIVRLADHIISDLLKPIRAHPCAMIDYQTQEVFTYLHFPEENAYMFVSRIDMNERSRA